MQATIVISTKNRKNDLRRAIISALTQVNVNIEIIIIDDGSTDGTSDMVNIEFPQIRLFSSKTSKGYIAQRNYGAQQASFPIIISLDDDAEFSTPYVVSQTINLFDDPFIGAIAIPFININKSLSIRQKAPSSDNIWLSRSYVGTAHAVKREVFLEIGGYREQLLHQCEENDFCIRLMNLGYVVRLGNADPIFHYESPKRCNRRIVSNNAKNNILFAWHNVPMPYLLLHIFMTTLHIVINGVKNGNVYYSIYGVVWGYVNIVFKEFTQRHPIYRKTYILYLRMRKKIFTLNQVKKVLIINRLSN